MAEPGRAVTLTVWVDTRVLDKLGGALNGRLRDVVQVAARNIETRSKQLVPVDTGATRASIAPTFSADGLEARIGPTTAYAPFLEFGTSHMAARPYMLPALEQERAAFLAAAGQVLGGRLG